MRPSVRVAVLATIASMSFSSIAQAELACWHPNEAKAAQIKDFQTLLMVGTLQCRTADANAVEDYNIFVRHNRSTIDSNIYALKTHFLRENGIQDGQRAYDEYSTALANEKAAQLGEPAFCDTVETLAGLAARASSADLMTLAQSVSLPPESGDCAPAGGAAAVIVQPDVAPKVEAAPEPRPYPSEQSAADPAPTVVAAAAVVPAAAPAPAKPTREEAMASAVTALQAAASALRAASASSSDVAPGVPEPDVKSVSLSKDAEDSSGVN